MATFLRYAGHEVVVFEDGPPAIVLAPSWKPTAAIIDIGLPSMSGYAVAQHLRRQNGANLLLIAQTSYDSPEEIEMARYAGFDWHFAKPAQPQLLIEVIQNPRRKPTAKRDGTPLVHSALSYATYDDAVKVEGSLEVRQPAQGHQLHRVAEVAQQYTSDLSFVYVLSKLL